MATLYYGSEPIEISKDADTVDVAARIDAAVKSGGGWVEIPSKGGIRAIYAATGQYISFKAGVRVTPETLYGT